MAAGRIRRHVWRGVRAGLTALIALLLLAPRAWSTVVVAKDFAALGAEADFIFVGTVTGRESRWADASRQAIETLVTFGDLTWLRGRPQATITLRFAGGEMDGLREEIAGVPSFAIGERRVIFARDGRYVSPIVGFDQGALRVVDGADGPLVAAPNGVNGPDGADASGHAVLRVGTPTAQQPSAPQPLNEYLDRVRRQLDEPTTR